ncbi:MAG: tetratricopeptide repeat protein [Bryobacteraceae bacterium]|jgi:tetratricopeptide (TPR) repeat protein
MKLHKAPVRPVTARRPASWPIYTAITAAALAAYWPALRGGFIWDDNAHVTTAAMRSLRGLWRIWFDLGATQQYYPLLHSAFWLEHRFWGDAVVGYHLANLAQHALAACLVVLIVRRLALPGAWLAGLIFALHPVCVESVAWISEQKSTLSGVFYLASALVYLRFDESRRRSHYIWAIALFICALLGKTVTATLPAALLVIFWWKRGRLDLRGDVRPLLPWFALGIAAGLFTAWVERTYIGARGAEFAITPVERFLIAARAPWFYAAKLFWPVNLIFTYPRWHIDPAVWWQWLFPVATLSVAIGFYLIARNKTTSHQPPTTSHGERSPSHGERSPSHGGRSPLAAFLFFAGTLFPALGFVNVYPFRFSWVADHFQYLACLGIIVPVAVVIAKVGQALPPAKAGAARFVLPLVLAALTFRQASMYGDTETLYRTTIARNPASWMAHNNLGVALAKMDGRSAEAIAEYQTALRIKPDYAEPHNNLATILSRQPGCMPEAIAEAQEALRIKPDYPEALVNLGSFLAPIPGRLRDAIASYQAALRIKPDHAEAHNNLGLALLEMPGRLPEAIKELEAAVRLEPDNAQMHDNLASALVRMPGRLPDAIAEVQAALEITPDDPQAHDFLGRALSQMPGRLPEAIAEFETALRIAPDYAQAHNDLGVVLLYVPERRADAIAEFRAALSLNPNDPRAQSNLQRAMSQQ